MVIATTGGGWSRTVYTATPGVPGDSGSGFLDGHGRAVGVLATLQLAPTAGSNGVTDLAMALRYLRESRGPAVALARGTEPFANRLA